MRGVLDLQRGSSRPRTGPAAHRPFLFQCPHLNVRKAAHEALGQFCCALQKACQRSPSEASSAGEEPSAAGWAPGAPAGRDRASGQLCLQLCGPPWLG